MSSDSSFTEPQKQSNFKSLQEKTETLRDWRLAVRKRILSKRIALFEKQHKELDVESNRLSRLHFRTAEEEVKLATVKKVKLKLRDNIQKIMKELLQ
jgi:uncharacterized protein YdcH (DUF465 family)